MSIKLAKPAALLALCLALGACASDKPRIIQPTAGMSELQLTEDMATQLEVPGSGRVELVAIGNPDLVRVEQDGNIITVAPKGEPGATNLIVHYIDEDGDKKIYQYRIVVPK